MDLNKQVNCLGSAARSDVSGHHWGRGDPALPPVLLPARPGPPDHHPLRPPAHHGLHHPDRQQVDEFTTGTLSFRTEFDVEDIFNKTYVDNSVLTILVNMLKL